MNKELINIAAVIIIVAGVHYFLPTFFGGVLATVVARIAQNVIGEDNV